MSLSDRGYSGTRGRRHGHGHWPRPRRAFYPTLLIVIAWLYPLFAVLGQASPVLAAESGIALAFTILAIMGFRYSLWLVVAGLASHGLLDLGHGQLLANPGSRYGGPALFHLRCSGSGVPGHPPTEAGSSGAPSLALGPLYDVPHLLQFCSSLLSEFPAFGPNAYSKRAANSLKRLDNAVRRSAGRETLDPLMVVRIHQGQLALGFVW